MAVWSAGWDELASFGKDYTGMQVNKILKTVFM